MAKADLSRSRYFGPASLQRIARRQAARTPCARTTRPVPDDSVLTGGALGLSSVGTPAGAILRWEGRGPAFARRGELRRFVLRKGLTWERQSPDWRCWVYVLKKRQSGDWRSRRRRQECRRYWDMRACRATIHVSYGGQGEAVEGRSRSLTQPLYWACVAAANRTPSGSAHPMCASHAAGSG